MGSNLVKLLPEVLKEDLLHIYVLDDASTDDSCRQIERFESPRLTLVRGESTVGSAANRNRIIPYLKGHEIVLFLDADMELVSRPIVPPIREVFLRSEVGVVGFRILNLDGSQYLWNHCGEQSTRTTILSLLIAKISKRSKGRTVNFFLRLLNRSLSDFWLFGRDVIEDQEVIQVAEGACAVRAGLFCSIGGFDGQLLHAESLDLGRHVRARGFIVWFLTGLTFRHLKLKVRGLSRSFHVLAAYRRLANKKRMGIYNKSQ
jgi:GT2 family glycosyltransferase